MLFAVATPVGNMNDISLRALEILKKCQHIICESTKETSTFLKFHQIKDKTYHVLSEHTRPEELQELVELCRNHDVALVSDCGTPVFCDPGSDLVGLCRREKIQVQPVLGASSLMGLLGVVSMKVPRFYFVGFLSAETEERRRQLSQLKNEKQAMIFMDTPYRQMKLLKEIGEAFPLRKMLLVQNLSLPEEMIFEGSMTEILSRVKIEKAEFMLLVYPVAEAKN